MTRLSILLLLAPTLVSGGGFTPAELSALYAADLGPDTVDVSGYPEVQKKNYAVFRRVCSTCHTTARALNSPRTSAAAWELYVFDMWREGVKHRGHRYSLEEAKAVQSFLAYDSARRKAGSRDFEEQTTYLQNRFASSIEERIRRLRAGQK